MNINAPLAAALLFSALTASAQSPLLQPASSLGPYKLDVAGFNTTNMPSDDDFNCSTAYNLHIPFKMCTPEQETRRLVYIGYCGTSQACKDYFERIMLPKDGGFGMAGTVGGATGANGTCPAPPCLEEAKPAAEQPIAASSSRVPQSGDADFIGPPLPPGFAEKQDQKRVEEARKEIGQNGVKEIIELDDGSLAKMHDDGMVEICGRQSCEKPVPADTIKNPKIERWVVDNKGYGGYPIANNDKRNGGMGMMSDKNQGSTGSGSSSTDESYTPASTENDGSPADIGRGLGPQIASLSGNEGGPGGGRTSSADSSVGYGPAEAPPIPVSQAEMEAASKGKGYEFLGNQKAAENSDALLEGGAKAFDTKVDPKDDAATYQGTRGAHQ